MKLENPANGFVRVEAERATILIDPWLSPGIFDGSWVNYPKVSDPDHFLKGATHCFITHIHEDHFDLQTLAKLPRSVLMLVPAVYPNHVIQAKLKGLGFEVVMLAEGQTFYASRDLRFEFIPRMNKYGQEADLYDEGDIPSMVIDTGVLIHVDGKKLAFLADNMPYRPEDAGSVIERMSECDLMAFSYNGFASDYPLCYDSLSWFEKVDIARERERVREQANLRFFDQLKPKALLCYSSELGIMGPRAVEFARLANKCRQTNKRATARWYDQQKGVPTFAIYEGEHLVFDHAGVRMVGRAYPPSLQTFQVQHFHWYANMAWTYRATNESELKALVERAADHMFSKMDKFGITSEWLFVVDTMGAMFVIDLASKLVGSLLHKDALFLRAIIEPSYLAALLRGDAHWNTAMGSFNITWERKPKHYDRGLYDAINFFHVPREV